MRSLELVKCLNAIAAIKALHEVTRNIEVYNKSLDKGLGPGESQY